MTRFVAVVGALVMGCGTATTTAMTDAAPGTPDAAATAFDAAPGTPDAAPGTPDAAPGTPDAAAPAPNRQWVMGYYVGYLMHAYPIAEIDWTGLSHIVFSPMTVKSDLSLDLSFDDEFGTGVEDARTLARDAHAHGVKALLMLGGANAGGNIATAARPGNRGAFVARLLAAMDDLGYDGIDLDWEDSVDVDDLVALAAALRAARPAMLLTYPAGTLNGNFQTADPRMAALAASLDRFFVQTYYPATAVAGQGWESWFVSPLSGVRPATPIAADDSLTRYAAVGVPRAKLGLGVAFYAICYTGGITGPRQPTDGGQRIVGGDNLYPLSAFFAGDGTYARSAAGERRRDDAAKSPYLSLPAPVADPGCGAPTQYISYDDETSILAKGAFSRAQGYGGIIIWNLAEGWLPAGAAEGRARNALMQALRAGFLAD